MNDDIPRRTILMALRMFPAGLYQPGTIVFIHNIHCRTCQRRCSTIETFLFLALFGAFTFIENWEYGLIATCAMILLIVSTCTRIIIRIPNTRIPTPFGMLTDELK